MKLFIKTVAVMTAMIFSQTVVAREALLTATIEKIKVVNISPEVQEQMKKASPDERSKLEDAISTGNLFIPQYFSFNAYDSDPENKDWDEETAPLISLGRDEWVQHYQWLDMNSKSIPFGKDVAYTYRLTCPQVSLIAVQLGKETVSLTYRTTSVGTLIDDYRNDLYDFNSEGAGDIYDLRLELDSQALVNKVTPPDQWITWSYTRPIAAMKEYLGDHGTAVFTTKEHENEKIRVYKKTIKSIEKSAAHYCK